MHSKREPKCGVIKHKNATMKSAAVKAALVDGLLSDSATHIHMLLQSQDKQLMADTMQQLSRSPRSIDAFLRTLADLTARHPQSAERALRWLNRLVEAHSGYIASSPELTQRLAGLRCQLQTRLASLQRLLMLKGRLDLLLGFQQGGGAGGCAGQQLLQPAPPAAVHRERDSSDDDVTEEEDEEGEGEGEEAEGPDDLAGQLLGDGSSSGEGEDEDADGEGETEGADEDDLIGSEEEDEDDGISDDESEDDEEAQLSSSGEEDEAPAAKVARRR